MALLYKIYNWKTSVHPTKNEDIQWEGFMTKVLTEKPFMQSAIHHKLVHKHLLALLITEANKTHKVSMMHTG